MSDPRVEDMTDRLYPVFAAFFRECDPGSQVSLYHLLTVAGVRSSDPYYRRWRDAADSALRRLVSERRAFPSPTSPTLYRVRDPRTIRRKFHV